MASTSPSELASPTRIQSAATSSTPPSVLAARRERMERQRRETLERIAQQRAREREQEAPPFEPPAASRTPETPRQRMERQRRATLERLAGYAVSRSGEVADATSAPPSAPPTCSSGTSSSADTYLNCPFEEKEEAKLLGARWSPDKKKWYVPAGQDVTAFRRWLPKRRHEAGSGDDLSVVRRRLDFDNFGSKGFHAAR